MILKELKKIISNRWIIFILTLLCSINVLLNIQTIEGEKSNIEQKRELAQQRIEEYDDYLENVKKNAELLSGFDLFAQQSKYQKVNAENTMAAYEKLENVELINGNYTIISKFSDLGFADIIIIICIIQCAVLLIHIDKNKEMLTLLKSCKKGRVSLSIEKITALFIFDFTIVSLVSAIDWISLYVTYGCSELSVPLQSVMDFYESAMPITIGEYLILFVIFKLMACFLISLIILFVAVMMDNVGLVYGAIGTIASASFVISANIMWGYSLAPIKILSPTTWIDIKSFTCKYYNLNIFDNPINILPLTCGVIVALTVIMTIAVVILFSTNANVCFGMKNRKLLFNSRKVSLKGIYYWEWKKLLITNKGIVVILLLILMQGFVISEAEYEMDSLDKYYSNYMKELEGPVGTSSDAFIDAETKRFEQIDEKYEENIQRFMKGEINQQAMMLIEEKYSWEIYPYTAFERVIERDTYLKKIDKKYGIKGKFFDDLGTNYLISPQLAYKENIAWIFMLMAMILLVILCMGYEELTGMDKLLDTTLSGTKKLFKTKLLITFLVTIFVFVVSNIPYLILIVQNYSFSGIDASIKSLPQFEKFGIDISVLTYLISIYVVKFVITLIAMLIVILISKKCRGYVKKIAYSVTVIIVPLIIFTVI